MAQARDEAGNIWEVDAQGNPVRLVQAAGGPQMPADPTFQYQGPKAQADLANTGSTIADREADNRRADAEAARAAEKADRERREWLATHNADGSPKPVMSAEDAAKAQGKQDKAAVVRSIMREVRTRYNRSIKGQPASRLFGATEYIDSLPANEDFSKTADGMLALIRPMVAMGAKDGDSDKEMEVFRAYIPSADDSDRTIESKLNNLEILLNGVVGGQRPSEVLATGALTGERRDTPPAVNPMQPPAGGGSPPPSFAGGGDSEKSIPIPDAMQQEHAAYLQQNWGRLDPDAYAQFRAGLDEKYGFAPRPDAYRAIVPQINKRAAEGGSPAGLNIPPVNAKMDGLDQVNASLFNNRVGGLAFGIGDQLGLADEMAGGIRSLVNGTPYDVEVARADAMKQAMGDRYRTENIVGNIGGALLTGAGAAKAFPGLTSALTGTTARAIGTGSAFGALSGAGEMNDNRLAGLAIGGGLGVAGGAAGAAASPVLRSAMDTRGGQALSRFSRGAWNNTAGRVPGVPTVAATPTVPQFAKGEGLLPADVLESAIPNLQDASNLNLPYSLADSDPQLRMLAGSVSRRSGDARQLAENIFEPRARGQAQRLVDNIDQRLAPITDIKNRSRELTEAGSTAASPYYQRAYAQNALDDPEVASILNTPSGKDALQRAYRIASDGRRDPAQMGFIYDEGTGGVRLNTTDGRYTTATEPLTSAAPTPPATEAGVPDLKHYEGSWFVIDRETGQPVTEIFKPDAALAARVNQSKYQLLPAADYLGRFNGMVKEAGGQQPTDDAFRAAFGSKAGPAAPPTNGPTSMRTFDEDLSEPAGPRPFAPAEAYGREVAMPTYETLHMVKRGFDDIVEENRDQFGKLNLAGKPLAQEVNNLRSALNNRLGTLNPDYAQANELFAGYAKAKDALQRGHDVLPRGNVPFRDFETNLADARAYDETNFMKPQTVPELQRGYATAMADQADKMRLSGNPYEAVFGSTDQQAKVNALFPEGARDFARVYGLERDMAKTAHETLGGSPTAARQAIDQQFDSGLLGVGTNLAADALGGGGAFTLKSMLGKGAQYIADTARLKGGKAKADAIAPVLFDPNPDTTLNYIVDLAMRQRMGKDRARSFARRAGMFGAIAPSAFLGSE